MFSLSFFFKGNIGGGEEVGRIELTATQHRTCDGNTQGIQTRTRYTEKVSLTLSPSISKPRRLRTSEAPGATT